MALFKILEPVVLVHFASIHSLHRGPALWGSHLRVADASHIKCSTYWWGNLWLRLLGMMATEILRLHLSLVIGGQVFGILPLSAHAVSTTSSSCSACAKFLHATVSLQLLALRLLPCNVRDHRVLVPWAARARISTYWTLLLLLLLLLLSLLQGKIISALAIAHLLL